MTPIANNEVYLQKMSIGLYDKSWWVDKIAPDVDTVIDFGCATGDLFCFVERMFPGRFKFIGIENNEEFFKDRYPYALYYTDIHDVEVDWEHTVLIMNSVIHELYSYVGDNALKEILAYVFDKGVRHVAIRDMDLSYEEDENGHILNWADDVAAVANKKYEKQWKEHLASYPAAASKNIIEQAVEFVLKYRYVENWCREVNERYLHDEMLSDIGYIMTRYNFYRENDDGSFYYFDYELPFHIPQQVDSIAADFGYFPDRLNTHVKLLITKGNLNE